MIVMVLYEEKGPWHLALVDCLIDQADKFVLISHSLFNYFIVDGKMQLLQIETLCIRIWPL